MQFAFGQGVSTDANSARAADAAAAEALAALDGRRPDLALLFLSPHHASDLEETVARLAERLRPARLIGCMGQGVIGGEHEIEESPGLVLLTAALPGVELKAAAVQAEMTPEGLAFSGLPDLTEGGGTILLFGEPFSFPVVEFLSRIEEDGSGWRVLGGMASGALSPGENRLFLDGQTLVDGAVCVCLPGPFRVRPLVSQGCRPFGKPVVVTKAQENLILELGGRPALERLQELIRELPAEDEPLLRNGLHLGRAIDPSRTSFGRGDFLVRNVIGIDPQKGAIALTDEVRSGQTVQFHLRDAHSASEDLEALLREARREGRPAAALLFSCNGRGSYMFGSKDHDSGAVRRELGPIPLAGFFAAGELGPVGGRNFLHGFTASIAIFEGE